MNSQLQSPFFAFPEDYTPLPPSPPLTPPGQGPYGPNWVADVLHAFCLAVVAAVTMCAVYVLVHFAWDALGAFPEAPEVAMAEAEEERVAE